MKKYILLDLVYGDFIGEPKPQNNMSWHSRPYHLVSQNNARIFEYKELKEYIKSFTWGHKIQIIKINKHGSACYLNY